MSFEILPQILAPSNPLLEREKKRARERLDLIAEQEKVGWKRVQLKGQDLFGKTKGFTIGECKRLMEEIRRGNL